MVELLNELEENNIAVFLDGEDLKLSYEGDTLDTSLLEKIRDHKEGIISFLQKYTQSSTYTDIPVAKKQENYPLSSSQYRIWATCSSDEVSVSYNVPNYFTLKGNYVVKFLTKAVEMTVDRHETLRTVFKEDEKGTIRQWILSREEIGFKVIYKDCLSIEDNEVYVQRDIQQDASHIFDLKIGPLLRFYIYQLAEDHLVLYCNMHHIISDTWSLGVLTNDIMTYYESFVQGTEPDMPMLRIQYKDYALWHNDQISDGHLKKQKEFWIKQFEGEIPVLDLPTHRSRPKIKTYNGVNLETYLSGETTKKLNEFCQQQGVSLYMALLAVWNIVFYRYTTATDITIGTAIAGRDHLDLKNQVGCFINTLALRNTIDPTDHFKEFCKQLKERTLLAYENQAFPFDQLINELGIQRDLSRGVLFDVMFLLQNAVDNKHESVIASDQINAIVTTGPKGVMSDLDITMREDGQYLKLDVVYNTDIYEQRLIEQIIKHYKQLLDSLLKNPNVPVGEVKYLTDTERGLLINDFNVTTLSPTEDHTILEVFQRQATQTPDNIAVVFENNTITYRELDIVSNRLAHFLVKHGAGIEQMIPICVERSVDMIVGILGILKTGAAYVPIDPEYPSERIQYILQDTKATLILSQQSLHEKLHSDHTAKIINIDQKEYVQFPETRVSHKVKSYNLIYVIYTSGTTGKPKGVLVEHGGFLNLAINQIQFFQVQPGTSALQFASMGFDASCSEIFTCLLAGGKLVIPSKATIGDSSKMVQLIKDQQVTLATIPPSYQTLILDELAQMNTIVSAGESLNSSATRVLQSKGVRIINAYGPTENSVCATMTENPIGDNGTISIGKPIGNTQVYILDKADKIVPIGVVGELCLAGKQVARGYHNRLKLTKEKFTPNPFSAEVNSRIYRTGDLGRWLPDGTIEFIGRKDDQVKIRGYRIELKEIQNTLINLDKVDQAIVLIKETAGQKHIAAYLTGGKIELTLIKQEIKKFLPEYMIPSFFIVLEEMPFTPNGKVDHNALLAIDNLDMSTVPFVEPSSDKEKVIIQAGKEVLKIDTISMLDSFYGLGGDSIKSIQFISVLKKHGYVVKAKDILTAGDFRELAILLSEDLHIVDQQKVEGAVVFTPIQNYFFEDSTFVTKHHYNQSVILKSIENIETEALVICIQHLVEHHDALRTIFPKKEGTWSQYIHTSSEKAFSIAFHDLTQEQEPLITLTRLAGNLQGSIDLENGPLFKIGHFRLSDGDRIVLIIHHLIVDGVSWRILLTDLVTLFSQYQQGVELMLPPKTDAYQRWAFLQTKYAKEPLLQKERKYWEEICTKDIQRLPQDMQTNDAILRYDDTVSFTLDKETTEILKTGVYQTYQTSINAILITALGLALKETFATEKTMLQLEGHGREDIISDVDISRTVGWFTTIYPFLLDLSDITNVIQAVLEIDQDLQRIPDKGIGYGILKYLSQSKFPNPNPSVEFNYLGDFGSSIDGSSSLFEYSSEDIGYSIHPSNGSTALLSVLGIMSFDQLTMSINFSKSVYKKDTVTTLVDRYQEYLKAIINELADPQPVETTNEELHNLEASIANPHTTFLLSERQKPFAVKSQSHGILNPIKVNWVSEQQIENTFREFLQKYPFLRIHLSDSYGNIMQNVVGASDVKLDIRYKKEYTPSQYSTIQEEALDFFHQPYDIYQGALIRLFVVKDSKDAAFMFVSIHHLITDMYTNQIIADQLQRFFDQNTIVPDFVSPTDFETWQRDYLISKEGANSKKFWIQTLGNLSFSNPLILDSYGDCITEKVTISGEAFRDIMETVNQYNVPLNGIMMAAHQSLLTSLQSVDKILQLVIVDGRDVIDDAMEVNKVLGVICNFLPIPIQPFSEIEEHNQVQSVFESYMEARLHQTIPYEVIRKSILNKTQVDIDTHIAGIFNFQQRNTTDVEIGEGSSYAKTENKNDYTKGADLTCVVYQNAIEISLTTSVQLLRQYPEVSIQAFLENLHHFKNNILEKF